MCDVKKKILFVGSEIYPFLPESRIAVIGRDLPQGVQERKREIRSFMPKYGCINERKNQLHEVIRLSGMNIIIDDLDRPLIIKVASISSARIQVYFIDNDDYFRRKQIHRDESGSFFQDNDERAIFFARGVLETVKKLRWIPEVIHCHGWITHMVPLYLKKAYKDDPIFANSRIVLSLYDDIQQESFSEGFATKALFGGVTAEDMELIAAQPNGITFAQTAARYSDGVIFGDEKLDEQLKTFCKSLGVPILDYNKASYEGTGYIDEYCSFYDKL